MIQIGGGGERLEWIVDRITCHRQASLLLEITSSVQLKVRYEEKIPVRNC